jgi:predicted regulator of Ras-like GTPase activity (Roadblock/LC7/MglB family)
MTKAELLAAGLDDFLAVSPDVEAAAVVSADGLPMASALPPYVEEDRLAAMSAALLTLGERAASGLGKGELAQVFVEAAQGYVVLMAAGRSAVLVAVTSGSAKVGLVLFEMRKAATRIAEVMGETVAVEHASAAEPAEPTEPAEPASPVEYPSENGAAPVADAGETPPLPEEESLEEEEYVEEAPASPQFGAPSTPPPAHESAFSTWH